jgi:Ca2+-binding RTX toxin-like protein
MLSEGGVTNTFLRDPRGATLPDSTGISAQKSNDIGKRERKQRTMKAAFEKTTWIGRMAALCLALAAAVSLSLAAFADTAEAKKKKIDKIVFSSDRTSGEGVSNPTGDDEIFIMNPDGTELKQLTFNTVDDSQPTLSPNGQKIVFVSSGAQFSNPQGDDEVYIMNSDGSDSQNLTDTSGSIEDLQPDFSPSSKKIVYKSFGAQSSNPEGDDEIYLMNSDGTDQQNLTDTTGSTLDFDPDFSPSGKKIAYGSAGIQFSNPEGDDEVYAMDADGTIKGGKGDDGGDTPNTQGLVPQLKGDGGDDVISGGAGADDLQGGEGNDRLSGDDGDDEELNGGPGDDKLFGGSGNDGVFGGLTDKLSGGSGNNEVRGGTGNDAIQADLSTTGDVEKLFGGKGTDAIFAKDGKKDVIDCGKGKFDLATFDEDLDQVKDCELTLAIPNTKATEHGDDQEGQQ